MAQIALMSHSSRLQPSLSTGRDHGAVRHHVGFKALRGPMMTNVAQISWLGLGGSGKSWGRIALLLHCTPVAAAVTNLLITLTSSSIVCSQLSASSTSQHPERLKSPFTAKDSAFDAMHMCHGQNPYLANGHLILTNNSVYIYIIHILHMKQRN